jgi:hypothetical protein
MLYRNVSAFGGHYVKWNKPGSGRQSLHIFSHTWEIDMIQIQAIVWKTGFSMGGSLIGGGV